MGLFTRIGILVGSVGSAAAMSTGCFGDPSNVEQREFQAKMVHALCDNIQACCDTANRMFDAVGCRNKVMSQYVQPLSDTSLRYDSAQAGTCISAVDTAARACKPVDPTTCFEAFTGNLPPGAMCKNGFDCSPGPGGFAVCGPDSTCVQVRRGVLGEVCAYTCVEGGNAPTCRSVFQGSAAAQAACHTDNGFVCVTATSPATCQPSFMDCKQNPNGSCAPGQICNLQTGACFVPSVIGASCAQVPCGKDGYCAGGVCVALLANGKECNEDAQCESGKCENSFCVVYSEAAAVWCGPLKEH